MMSSVSSSPEQASSSSEEVIVRRAVTMIVGVVVGLTFMFGFGNVWSLAVRLGVPAFVAPLVAPAVDLSVVGLLVGCRYLALHDGSPEVLRRARWLLLFCSAVTLGLNVAEPLTAGRIGTAAFDAVGPFLLIGWSEVGPALLQDINALGESPASEIATESSVRSVTPRVVGAPATDFTAAELLQQARQEDARHRAAYQRPISAETLRKRLRVGARLSRSLVAVVREEYRGKSSAVSDEATSSSRFLVTESG